MPSQNEEVVEGGGFEPPKAYAGRFTVCSLWPLGHPSSTANDHRVESALSLLPNRRCSRSCSILLGEIGAGGGTRTRDLLITSQVLYRLSYASEIATQIRSPHDRLVGAPCIRSPIPSRQPEIGSNRGSFPAREPPADTLLCGRAFAPCRAPLKAPSVPECSSRHPSHQPGPGARRRRLDPRRVRAGAPRARRRAPSRGCQRPHPRAPRPPG
jgi:hypothetical protein